MRIVATGKAGQVVTALMERGAELGVEVIPVGRPQLDLASPTPDFSAIRRARPHVIVSTAAYTAVDQAEGDLAAVEAINAIGPGRLAGVARELGIPIIHLSTDYVFDGGKTEPYREDDPTGPLGVYGKTKLNGEVAVAVATPNHVILRTAWVYSPFGSNFLKTMLRVAAERDELRVVDDQHGNPTSALDVANAVIGVARNLVARPRDTSLRGVFHMTGSGEASWADFASEILEISGRLGGPAARVTRIRTADYPTPARRPMNSRLSNAKLQRVHGQVLPDWRTSTRIAVARLLNEPL